LRSGSLPGPAPRRWLSAPFGALLRAPGSLDALAHVGLATLAITLLALALPILLLQAYDRILPAAALGTLALLAGGAGAAILAEAALRALRGAVLNRLAARAEARAHAAAIAQVAGASGESFDQHGNGWYFERLAAIATLRETWSGPALQALVDLPFAGLYLFALYLVGGPLVLVPALALLLILLLAWGNGRRVRGRAASLQAAEERRSNFLFDVLAGLQSFKLIGAEPLLERRHERLQGGSAALRQRLTDATATGAEGGLLLAQATALATAGWGALMALEGALTMGALGACTMLAGRSLQPLLGASALWSRLRTMQEQGRRVRQLLELVPDGRPGLPALHLAPDQGGPLGVEFRSVRYGVRAGGRFLFDRLSFTVAPGECVGIGGANGAGFSSLLRLIAADARPLAGHVLLAGQDLARLDPVSIRRVVGLVLPNAPMLGGTLLENLTLHDAALNDRALGLAEAFGLDGVAAGLAVGWHTPIGPGHAPLPRGVMQRVALVRALARQPRILLLDGVTDQLDADGDRRLAQVLAGLKGRMTVLHATHRPSALARCDRVLRFADGRLVPAPQGGDR